MPKKMEMCCGTLKIFLSSKKGFVNYGSHRIENPKGNS